MLFALHTTPTLTFDMAVNGGFSCTDKIETPYKWPIPGTPFLVDVGGKLNWSANESLTVHAVAAASTTLGFDITGANADNLSDVDFFGDGSLTGNATMSFTPALTLGLKLFGLVGVEGSFGMKLTAAHDLGKDPCNQITLAPTVGFSFSADLWLKSWSVTVASFTGPEALLFSTSVGCPPSLGRWTGTITLTATSSWVSGYFGAPGSGPTTMTFTLGGLAQPAAAGPVQTCNFGWGDIAQCQAYSFNQTGTAAGTMSLTQKRPQVEYPNCTANDLISGAFDIIAPDPQREPASLVLFHRFDTDQWAIFPYMYAGRGQRSCVDDGM